MKDIKGIVASGLITAIVFLFILGLYIDMDRNSDSRPELTEVKLPSVDKMDKKEKRVLTILDRLDKVWSGTEELYP